MSAQEFAEFILPHLSLPKRESQCKIGSHQPFHYMLEVLSTGKQGKEFPIDTGPEGPAIPGERKRAGRAGSWWWELLRLSG